MSSYNIPTPKGVVINNPYTGTLNSDTDISIDSIWQKMQQLPLHNNTYFDPTSNSLEDNLVKLEKKMQALELQHTLLKLKVLCMEGKFTQEEVTNIRKMIMSEDEASRTLANTIIENA
jgi:hypothetical protein